MKETGLEEEEKSIFCIPHYICTFRRNRTILHSNTTSEYSFQGSMLTKEDANDHQRTIVIEDNVLHRKTLLAHGQWKVLLVTDYMDHNTGYVSTFQKTKEKRKKKGEKAKIEKCWKG